MDGVLSQDKRKKILVVDDDETLLDTYVSVFKNAGFEVFSAKDGEEAWEMLQLGVRPDIIFTGIIMPRMGGFELIMKMKSDQLLSGIAVAISSHRGLPEDEARAKSLGVKDFIVQGFTTPLEVVRRIQLLLGERKKYRIYLDLDRYDAQLLMRLLSKKQGINCSPALGKEILLELEEIEESGKFKATLIC